MFELKSWPLAFGRIVGRQIDLDPRLNLREFIDPGDVILYREFSPMSGMYSGRQALVTIAAVWKGVEEFDPFTQMGLTILKIASVKMLPTQQPSPEMDLPHD